MVNILQLKEGQKKDLQQSLKIIDLYVEWMRKTPNKIWSTQQAGLFKSVYGAINKNWRKSK
ncbi:hypothetical protein HY988_01665 [Candidatus Micrarchaeota archaeon]|nr:hypothetical protein [Candidatus Micrarchaeota archaeon]